MIGIPQQISAPAAALLLSLLLAAPACLAGSAKVLLYHHVATDAPASTSVTPTVFDSHLKLIEDEGFTVVPLQLIVDTLVKGAAFDSKWVAITFDDAYQSILTNAAPRLARRGWPFTVFASTRFVDDGNPPYLGWEQLRELEKLGGTIANHTISHEHMVRLRSGETTDAWRSRLIDDVVGAQQRLEDELAEPLRLFAYPYGEFNAEIAALMQSLGFISFGQQSGPVGATTSLYAIPRFPLGTGFDSVSSLAEKLRTEHLPLLDPPLPATVLSADAPTPVLSLTLADDSSVRTGTLNCFIAGQPQTEVRWSGTAQFSVTARQPIRAGRSKYTCTAPHPTIKRAYYWHTHLWIKPHPDGSWYEG